MADRLDTTVAAASAEAAMGPCSTRRGNGQVVVIFAGAMLVMMLMMAVVIDVSWLWSSALRIQRAADAAALAGAATLPTNPVRGIRLANEAAIKNGFDDSQPDVIVDKDYNALTNPYRMNVTITAPVETFFMRVVGLNSFNVTRTAHAELNLPLKMGSPEQWYGVGTFEKLDPVQGPPVRADADTDWRSHGTVPPGGAWTTPQFADDQNDGAFGRSPVLSDSEQQWGGFGLTSSGPNPIPDDPSLVIEGIEVRYRALTTGTDVPDTGCQLRTDLSWDGGTSWTTTPVDRNLTTAEDLYELGDDSSLADWPRASGTWNDASFFNNSNFRVRLTWNKLSGACGADRRASVDTLEVRVTYHSLVPGPVTFEPVTEPVPPPPGETVVPTSRGFWGAIFTAGGVRRNGDRYAPKWYYTGSSALNPEQVLTGYDYNVELGGANGRVYLFDPVFCATGLNPAGSGNYGAGDHWTDLPASGGIANGPVTTEFRLYDTNGTMIEKGDDTLVATKSYTSRASDQSGEFDDPADGSGTGDIPTGGVIADCRNDPAHNTWETLQAGLSAGTYRINVTSSQPGNAQTGAENLWSIYVADDGPVGSARVYGDATMVAYSNLTGDPVTGGPAKQEFYLAQVEEKHAGKTMEIRLFDPGDVAGDATLRILSPDGGSYAYATFDYEADGECVSGRSDACSGSSQTSIRTAISGQSSFDNSVITITIPLPVTYGSGGLTPPGENEPGWWKIEYTVGAANDTTTWEVSILENPVHLVVE
jgi:hypothetical protein